MFVFVYGEVAVVKGGEEGDPRGQVPIGTFTARVEEWTTEGKTKGKISCER